MPSNGAKVGCPGVGGCSELQEATRLLQLGEAEVEHAAAEETAAATASLRPALKSVPNRPRRQVLAKQAREVGSKADKSEATGTTKSSVAVVVPPRSAKQPSYHGKASRDAESQEELSLRTRDESGELLTDKSAPLHSPLSWTRQAEQTRQEVGAVARGRSGQCRSTFRRLDKPGQRTPAKHVAG